MSAGAIAVKSLRRTIVLHTDYQIDDIIMLGAGAGIGNVSALRSAPLPVARFCQYR